MRAKQKRTPPPPGRPPPDEPPSVRPMTSFPDPYRPPVNPSPEPPRLFGRTIFDQPIPNGGAVARPLDPPRNPPGDAGRTVSSGRVAVDVELVNLGRLVPRAGWWDERSIYPGGYRSAVSFYSTRDVTRKCLFFQEIMEHWDATVQPLPVFKVRIDVPNKALRWQSTLFARCSEGIKPIVDFLFPHRKGCGPFWSPSLHTAEIAEIISFLFLPFESQFQPVC